MGYKLSQVLDDPMESVVNRIPSVTLRERDGQELSSAMALLANTILPGGNHSFQLNAAEWEESDNYQVALVPLRSNTDRALKNSGAPLEAKPVLVLSLTWRELVARLRTVISPSGSDRESSVVRLGQVVVDFSSMEVSRSGEMVALKAMEFKLLRFLVQNPGRAISREEILNKVWGYENYPCTRTVDNHVLKLRQKLELDPSHPVHFLTVHAVGYKFVLEASRRVAEQKM